MLLSEKINEAIDNLDKTFKHHKAGTYNGQGFTLSWNTTQDYLELHFKSPEGETRSRADSPVRVAQFFKTSCKQKMRVIHEEGEPYPDGDVVDMDLSGMGVR